MATSSFDKSIFSRCILIAAGIVAIVMLLLLSGWYFAHVLLLTFAGVLLAIFLRGLAEWFSQWTPLPVGGSLGLVTVLLFAALGALFWFLGPAFLNGFDQLVQTLADAAKGLEQYKEAA